MKFVKKCYIGVALTGLLSACSSGGGGSDDAAPAPPPAAPAAKPVAITPANAAKVSAEAYFGVVDTRDFGTDGLGSVGITAAVVNVNNVSFDWFNFTQQIISRLPELNGSLAGDMVSAVVISPETFQCVDGGTLTVSGEVDDPEVDTAGDTIDVELEDCVESYGVLNGQVSLLFNSISKNSSNEVTGFNATLTMTDFSVVFAGETWTSNGDITTAIQDLSEVERNATLSGTAFTVTRGSQASTLRNFSIAEIRSLATFTTSTNLSGTVESAAIGGSATFETIEIFQLGDEEFPFEGSALIRGANGSSTQITAINSAEVRLDIDADGDNSFEQSIATTWDALAQL